MLKRAFFGLAILLAACAGLMAIPSVRAAGIALATGPAGNNPVEFPAVLTDINNLTTDINNAIGSWLTLNNSTSEAGELAFSSSSTFAVNKTATVTALGSTGPSGSTCGVNEWLTLVDEGGAVLFMPAYRCF